MIDKAPPRNCPACCAIRVGSAPDLSAPYLAALAEVTSDSLEVIVGELCPVHRTIYDSFVQITKEGTS